MSITHQTLAKEFDSHILYAFFRYIEEQRNFIQYDFITNKDELTEELNQIESIYLKMKTNSYIEEFKQFDKELLEQYQDPDTKMYFAMYAIIVDKYLENNTDKLEVDVEHDLVAIHNYLYEILFKEESLSEAFPYVITWEKCDDSKAKKTRLHLTIHDNLDEVDENLYKECRELSEKLKHFRSLQFKRAMNRVFKSYYTIDESEREIMIEKIESLWV